MDRKIIKLITLAALVFRSALGYAQSIAMNDNSAGKRIRFDLED